MSVPEYRSKKKLSGTKSIRNTIKKNKKEILVVIFFSFSSSVPSVMDLKLSFFNLNPALALISDPVCFNKDIRIVSLFSRQKIGTPTKCHKTKVSSLKTSQDIESQLNDNPNYKLAQLQDDPSLKTSQLYSFLNTKCLEYKCPNSR